MPADSAARDLQPPVDVEPVVPPPLRPPVVVEPVAARQEPPEEKTALAVVTGDPFVAVRKMLAGALPENVVNKLLAPTGVSRALQDYASQAALNQTSEEFVATLLKGAGLSTQEQSQVLECQAARDALARYAFLAQPAGLTYDFEGDGGVWHRTRQKAFESAQKMLERLGLQPDDRAKAMSNVEMRRALLGFATEVHLNIEWYVAKMKASTREHNLLMLAISAVAVVGVAAVPLLGVASGKGPLEISNAGVVFAQLSTFVGAGFGILRFLASLDSSKGRLALFWQARSDLTEQLYLFEREWRGKYLAGAALDGAFITALENGVEKARQVTRTERTQFFATLLSATDAATSASSIFDQVFGKHTDVSSAQQAALTAQATAAAQGKPPDLTALRRSLAEKTGAETAAQLILDRLQKKQPPTPDAVTAAAKDLDNATADRIKAQALLDAVLKG